MASPIHLRDLRPLTSPSPATSTRHDHDFVQERYRVDLSKFRHGGRFSHVVDDHLPREISGPRWAIVVLAIMSSTFLFALDNTVVADVQPHIVLQFDAVDQLAWLSVAFIMAAVSTNLLFGQLYSQLLPKWLYIGSVAVFEVGSAVCGAAPNMPILIVGRALCGLGGSGMYLGVMTLVAATTSVSERPLYIGGIGLTWGLGTILGPLIGGAFADSPATWRWAFYINLVAGAFIIPVYLLMLPSPDPKPGENLRSRLSEIDFLGAALMLGAVATFVVAINFGGIVYSWSSPMEVGLFVVSEGLTILFGFQQWQCWATTKQHRLLPMEILTGTAARTTVLMFCTTAAGGTGIFVPVYFIPLFFEFTRGDSAVHAAVRLLPFILFGVVITLGQGALLSHPSGKFSLYAVWFMSGGLLATIGGILMYFASASSSDAWVYGSSVLLGTGVGMFSQVGFSVAQASVDEALGSKVAAFIALGQTTGITMSLAIANSMFINDASRRLAEILGPGMTKEQIKAAIAGVGTDFINKLGPEIKAVVLGAVVDAMRKAYILVIVAGVLVMVLTLAMKWERLFMASGAAAAWAVHA